MFDDFMLKIEEHEKWRAEECINLIPSENYTSIQVQKILSSDMGRRYTLPLNQEVHGSLVENAYRGTKYLDEVEKLGEKTARKIYNAEYACLRPLSGHISGLISLLSSCKRGDLILIINATQGGYDGYMPDYMPSYLGLEVDYLPFDESEWNLNFDACVDMIARKKPRVVVIGSSFILFPYDLNKLSDACRESGALLLYDASHVLGLMPWNFQDPLNEGVDLLYGSTHKSFFGPQGGIVLTKNEGLFKNVLKNTTWNVLDNAHWNRIAALTQALLEYDKYGQEYGAQVVKNSKTFAQELVNVGIPLKFVEKGYTRSHMLLIDHEKLRSEHNLGLNEFSVRLERSNIISDSVGRMGVNEVTRLGAQEEHMKELAGLIRTALDRDVKSETMSFRKTLSLKFCL